MNKLKEARLATVDAVLLAVTKSMPDLRSTEQNNPKALKLQSLKVKKASVLLHFAIVLVLVQTMTFLMRKLNQQMLMK